MGRDLDLYTLRLASPDDIAEVLAICRAAGAAVDDVEVGPADLEDVFLQLTSDRIGSRQGAA